MTDEEYMMLAVFAAKQAASLDEVPVGALIVQDDRILASCYNLRENSKCATHHAEILAIEEACRILGGWRLPRCRMYVTLEPCPMCMGAIINARIDEVIFGAYDKRAGACGSLFDLQAFPLNHKTAVRGGVLEDTCSALLHEYFKEKRKK